MKIALSIATGYLLAAILATAGVWLYHSLATLDPAEASGGMAAFGDLVLFMALFSLAALLPTAKILRLLRGSQAFWTGWSSLSLLVTATGVFMSALILAPGLVRAGAFPTLDMLAPLRVLIAAPLAMIFALSALVAPGVRAKWVFLICTGIELIGFTSVMLKWTLGSAG